MAHARRDAVHPAILAGHPFIDYPDYSRSEDFTSWLTGYISRIQCSVGFRVNETDKVRDEVVRSIPGKLAVGSALDAYNRLSDDVKQNYDQLVAKLTEEFTDPKAKRKFNARSDYNIRKKGQSLKDFAEDIKKDMARYSYLPATVYTATGSVVPNPEREQQGVRRFIEGMRNEKGEVDEAFTRDLSYRLQNPKELKWDYALEVASRFEAADNDVEVRAIKNEFTDDLDDDSDDNDESEESEEEFEAAAVKVRSKSKLRDRLSIILEQTECILVLKKNE